MTQKIMNIPSFTFHGGAIHKCTFAVVSFPIICEYLSDWRKGTNQPSTTPDPFWISPLDSNANMNVIHYYEAQFECDDHCMIEILNEDDDTVKPIVAFWPVKLGTYLDDIGPRLRYDLYEVSRRFYEDSWRRIVSYIKEAEVMKAEKENADKREAAKNGPKKQKAEKTEPKREKAKTKEAEKKQEVAGSSAGSNKRYTLRNKPAE